MLAPAAYNCLSHFKRHLGNSEIFEDHIMPRQLQMYLPGDHKRACNLKCFYCAGSLNSKELVAWEETGLKLLKNLQGRIPYIIFSGGNTEATLSPYFLPLILATKQYGSCYGIKTNGALLKKLQEEHRFLTQACNAATSKEDFFSISLDAGFSTTLVKIKGADQRAFSDITTSMRWLSTIRGDKEYPALRVSYILNKYNDDTDQIKNAIAIVKDVGFDSIRFSQPHPIYGSAKSVSNKWWQRVIDKDKYYQELFAPLLSEDKPFVFYASPCRDNPDKPFTQCVYGYYQITLSHDGYIYKCTSVASSIFKGVRLGKITSDIAEFEKAVYDNQDRCFNPKICYRQGAYCCRAGIAINSEWQMEEHNEAAVY